MRSIGADPKEWPTEPFEDLEPRRHLIADLKSEKDKQHRIHLITAATLATPLQQQHWQRIGV